MTKEEAVANLIKVKGRHNTEIAYQKLIEAFDADKPVFCGCGDQIMPDDGAECGTCVTARNAVKQEPLAQMREMLEVQGRDGTWNYDTYSQGMYNGMELMMALAEGRDPNYREAPEQWLGTQEKYMELLYAVASKFPDETRHQTALRYIKNAESQTDMEAKKDSNG